MNFKDKFDKMIDIVEENVEKDSKDIAPIIGKELIVAGRTVNEAFSFITSMPFASYVRGRKLARVIEDVKRMPKKERDKRQNVIENIAYKYGYSDRSTFDRAFKAYYKVTPADVVNNDKPFECVERLSLEMIMESSMENVINPEFIDEKTTAAVIDNLVNSGSMIINLESEHDRALLNDIIDYQALYGLSTEQVLLAYELSEDKSARGVSRACEAICFGCKELNVKEITDDMRDVLYLVVNYNLYFEEAEKIVLDIRSGSNVDIRRLDRSYIELVVKYNYIDGCILENLPYDVYRKRRTFIFNLANRAMDLGIAPTEDGRLRLRADDLFAACISLAANFSKSEIAKPTKDIIRQMDLVVAGAKGMRHMTRSKAVAIIEDLKNMGINNWRECDSDYLDIMFAVSGAIPLSYSSYLGLVNDLKEYGVTDPDDIREVVIKTTEDGWDGPFDEVVDEILYKRNLSKSFNLSIINIEELEKLCNFRVSLEDACEEFTQSTGKKAIPPRNIYISSVKHGSEETIERRKKLLLSPGEKLALMISLNTMTPYEDVRSNLIKEFKEANADFEIPDELFYEINLEAASANSASIIEDGYDIPFNPVTYSDYKRIIDLLPSTTKRKEDVVFFAAVAYSCGVYQSLEESVERISQIANDIKNLPEEGVLYREGILGSFTYDERFRGVKPHNVELEKLINMIWIDDSSNSEYEKTSETSTLDEIREREALEMWAPAFGWTFSGPLTRKPYEE